MAILNITAEEIQQARILNAEGNTSEAWKLLGDKGDAYAYLASAIVSNDTASMSGIARIFYEMVRIHWDNTAGVDLWGSQIYKDVAQRHLENYLDSLVEVPDGYTLPTTLQIEASYKEALNFYNAPAEAAIDSMFSVVDTGLGSGSLPDGFDFSWAEIMNLANIAMGGPEWQSDRIVYNSNVFVDDVSMVDAAVTMGRDVVDALERSGLEAALVSTPLAPAYWALQITDTILDYTILDMVNRNAVLALVNQFQGGTPDVGDSLLGVIGNQDRESFSQLTDKIANTLGFSLQSSGASRAQLFTNVKTVSDWIQASGLTLSIESIASSDSTAIANVAKSNGTNAMAYRYALVELNPFVINGFDYSAHNQSGELELFSDSNPNGMTEQYIQDRAEMLALKMLFDSGVGDYNDFILLGDKAYTDEWDSLDPGDWQYRDIASGITLTIDGIGTDDHIIAFGDGLNNVINGGNVSDRLYGGAGNDTLNGNEDDDYIEGNAGADTLNGGTGGDTLRGGAGNDTLNGGSGSDYIEGNSGADTINGGADGDHLFGGAGIDLIDGGDGDDNIEGNGDDDTISGGAGGDTIFGGAGDDIIEGDGDIDYIEGNDGADTLNGGAGVDTLLGGAGDDILIGGTGTDTLKGGAGNDTYIYNTGDGTDIIEDADGSIIYNGVALTGGMRLGNVDTFNNGAFNDFTYKSADGSITYLLLNSQQTGGDPRLLIKGPAGTLIVNNFQNGDLNINLANALGEASGVGSDWTRTGTLSDDSINGLYLANDTIDGFAGNDKLYGSGGDDLINGGEGNDVLAGAAGKDLLNGGLGSDYILGGSHDDTITDESGLNVILGGRGADVVYGGADTDIINGGGSHNGAEEYMPTVSWTVEVSYATNLPSIHSISVTSVGRTILDIDVDIDGPVEDDAGDTIFGGAGDDFILGDLGDDTIFGELDNDFLNGGAGNDLLDGGAGDDHLVGDYGDGVLSGYDDGLTTNFLSNLTGSDTLIGGAGNDLLRGMHGDDYLYGESGNDKLIGDDETRPQYAGNDFLDGGAGDDTLFGGVGNDVLMGGAGIDTLIGDDDVSDVSLHGNDTLDGGDGADILQGRGGNDRLDGGTGNDQLWGEQGNDIIHGGADDDQLGGGIGDDTLYGDAGRDSLIGNAGADTLIGGAGSDTILIDTDDTAVFNPGDGEDLVRLDGNGGTLRFDGIHSSAIGVSQAGDGQTLVVAYADFNAAYIEKGFAATATQYVFANETRSLSQLLELADSLTLSGSDSADTVTGGGQADYLFANAGDDVLSGGRGNDQLDGGLGDDIYQFNLGDGQDTITDYSNTANADSIRFGAGITGVDLTFSQLNDDLVIDIAGTQDQIRISEWFNTTGRFQVENLIFADSSVADIASMVIAQGGIDVGTDLVLNGDAGDNTLTASAGDDELYGGAGNDTLVGGSGDDRLEGGAGNDVLTGGAGNDTLLGGSGDDTYHYNVGDGFDYISEASDSSGSTMDSVLFGAGISTDMVTVDRQSDNIILRVGGNADQLTISGWFATDSSKVESINFADGTVWDAAYIEAAVAGDTGGGGVGGGLEDIVFGTDGNDLITLGLGDDVADGLGGNDQIFGGEGNDIIVGGAGNDSLNGESGDNVFLFNRGDGSDFIRFFLHDAGTGINTLSLGNGVSPSDIEIGLVSSEGGLASQLSINNNGGSVDLGLRSRLVIEGGDILAPIGHEFVYGIQRLQFIDETGVRQFDMENAYIDALPLSTDSFYYNIVLTYEDLLPYEITGVTTPVGGDTAQNYALNGELGISGETIMGAEGDATIIGSEQDDFISTYAQLVESYDLLPPTVVFGGGGNDRIVSNGNDIIHAGAGNDTIRLASSRATVYGGLGDDRYIVDNAAGTYVIYEGRAPDVNTSGGQSGSLNISGYSGAISLGFGSLVINSAQGGSVHLANFDKNDVYGYSGIETFILSGGVELSYVDFVSRGFDVDGDDEDNELTGSNITDRINGLAGDDIISTGDGDDRLDGGAGNDLLEGGAGNDIYLYSSGDGHDVISDVGGADQLQFGVGITANDLVITDVGDDLLITIDGNSSLTIRDWGLGNRVEQFVFSDNSNLSAPTVSSPILAQTATEDTEFNFMLPATTFSDADVGDSLMLDATLADGSPLPSWLSFDVATQTFSGTPLNGDVGGLSVRVTATDSSGLSVFDDFLLSVENSNDAPTLTSAIIDQNVMEGTLFNFVVPAETYNDVDAGDSLVLNATLSDGSPLPAWLSFDAPTQTFNGTPGIGDVGSLDVKVTATDLAGATVSDTFVLNIETEATIINGTPYSETLTGTAGVDLIRGYAGNDAISGLDSNDALIGGLGNDHLYGGAGDDLFLYSDGDGFDRVNGGDGIDTLRGSAGDDAIGLSTFSGSNTVEVIDGGLGNNIIENNDYSNTLDFSGTTLVNIAGIYGRGGHDSLTGSAGNDTLVGGLGNDHLYGGAGDDLFLYSDGDGFDRVNGGDGIDTLRGSAGDDAIGLSTFSGSNTVEVIDGGAGYNIIENNSYSNTLDFSATTLINIAAIHGMGGHDSITGSAGNDTLVGGLGNDHLYGGAGDDLFQYTEGDGFDRINGGDGIDTLQGSVLDDTIGLSTFSSSNTVEVIDGGAGYNIIENNNYSNTLDFSGTTLVNIAGIYGRGGHDSLTGSAGDDTLVGGTGNDHLYGGAGDDLFQYSDGDGFDRVNGGDGVDTLQGSTGDDAIGLSTFSGSNTVEVIDGGAGYNIIENNDYSNTLDFSGTTLVNIAGIYGRGGHDSITGSAGNDTLVGGLGNDHLYGGAGDDLFQYTEGDGFDRVNGGDGIDTLLGSAADDTIGLSTFSGSTTVELVDGGTGYNVIQNNDYSNTLDFSGTTLVNIAAIYGQGGHDSITGSAGNDTLVGGLGDDHLYGGLGDDLFQYTEGDGFDRVNGGDGIDTLEGSAADDTIGLSTFSGSNTVEVIDGGAGTNTIRNNDYSNTLDFSGTTLVNIAAIYGMGGHDSLTGSAGNDTLVGGTGNDHLYGGAGSDIYILGRGDGSDTVYDYNVQDAQPDIYGTTEDRALFGEDITAEQLWFSRNGNSLNVSVIGTTDQFVVSNWYGGDAYQLDRFETADGSYLLDTQVEQLVSAMAAFSPPGAGETTLSPELQNELQPVIAAAWQSAA